MTWNRPSMPRPFPVQPVPRSRSILRGLVLHVNNGGPMKGATMVATLERLGVLASYSRPSVSNDNANSESLFRALKYCPAYPTQPFGDRAGAPARVKPSCAGTTANTCTAPFGSSHPTA